MRKNNYKYLLSSSHSCGWMSTSIGIFTRLSNKKLTLSIQEYTDIFNNIRILTIVQVVLDGWNTNHYLNIPFVLYYIIIMI